MLFRGRGPGLSRFAGTRVCYQSDAQPCPQLVLGFSSGGRARLEVYDQDCLLSTTSRLRWTCTGPDEVTLDGEVEGWDPARGELFTASWGLLTAAACAMP